MKIAIITVAYNRVSSLSRLLNSLDRAIYPQNKGITLIISVDKSKTDVVETFADAYQWRYGEKIVDKHEENLGLRPHMMSLGKWFDRFDAIIILEDDIVVSPNFYNYSCQTVEKYYDCAQIAGISLYGFSVNYQTGIPYNFIKDEHDAFFMKCAMSWGEVWMRDSWMQFYEWYLKHQEFPLLSHLPYSICSWNEKSWLKFHTRYCIEENKFFVYPYTSLTSNYGDAGEHSKGVANTVYQVPVQLGRKDVYYLPEFGSDAVYYDGFFENMSLYQKLGLNTDNLCLDLHGEWKNRLKKEYWLTTEVKNFKIVKSYGLNYRPIELNVLLDNPGEGIFLYDTNVNAKNHIKKKSKVLLYHYHLYNMFYFVRRYGWRNFLTDTFQVVISKMKSLL